MKTLILSAALGFLAVALHEFALFAGLSHPWLSWPVGIVVFGLSFIAIGEYETRTR